jgi:hypothetical protein
VGGAVEVCEVATKKAVKKPKRAAASRTAAKKTPAKKTPAKKTPPKKHGRRRDFGGPIESYISTLEGEQRDIAAKLRTIVRKAAPGAEEVLKWGMPVYELDGLLCYFRAFQGHVSFGFYDHAGLLDDPDRTLEGTGKGAHVKLRSLGDIDAGRIAGWVRIVAARNRAR